ncbi:uncharacterized protein [Coffea arabica]|uniref:Endonuclease/exonuclease/phosphatase domain-containing protein n=1 Tax=Coffea arabica TaxID=13443 RepID=A0ABM4V3M0_COFAR
MRALVWNCQGVGSPLTVLHLREVNNLLSPSLIFLSETKNRKYVLDKIARGLRFDNSAVVEAMHKAGGMAILWKEETLILEVNQTAFTIEGRIKDDDYHCDWWFIGIYASCDDQIRKEQWRVLRDRRRLWGDRFMIAGDFNDIVSNEEKWGGNLKEERSFTEFKDFIDHTNLIDLGFEGQPWTWSNHWEDEGEIRQRLDRCLASYDWVQTFEKARCQHLDTYASDHSILCLDTEPDKEKRKKKFYFDKRWLQKKEVQQVVEQAWQIDEPGSRMFKVIKKIRNCRIELLKWRNTFQADSKRRIVEIGKALEKVRVSDSDNKKEQVAELKNQLKEAYKEEEKFWRQKARIEWLREGDKNTKYFHAFVRGRRTKNRIRNLQRDDGSWTGNEEKVISEISGFLEGCLQVEGETICQRS